MKGGKPSEPSKPFATLVESAGLSEDGLLLAIQLKESPALEERNLFFSFVEQLAKTLKLIQPAIRFATKEIQLLFDRSIPLLSSFIEELKLFLFPHGEGDIIKDRITPL